MMPDFFSERENGHIPRTREDIPDNVWSGIASYIHQLLSKEYFGDSFPIICPENQVKCGCDKKAFYSEMKAFIPALTIPLDPNIKTDKFSILDLIEFCHHHVACPKDNPYFHSYLQHYHYEYDKNKGQNEFRDKINSIFDRNGLIFELTDDGLIIRLGSEITRAAIIGHIFNTRDDVLNELLDTARNEFLSPDPSKRRDSLKNLWDAFERLKTLENPANKRLSAGILIKKTATEPLFINKLEIEFRELTDIGNEFRIRHHETDRTELESKEQVDYFFTRLFALIDLVLRRIERI